MAEQLARYRQRIGTAAAWTSADPTLADGELGFESDTRLFKIGDGVTAWTALSYSASSGGVSDHGALTGLADDDHTQYALADGSRGTFATAAQGATADTATQPADLATAISDHAGAADPHGDRAYADGLAGNYATAAQGSTADTAVQPGDLGNAAGDDYGTTAGTVCEGDDSRLSDARTPTAHAASHQGGADDLPGLTAQATATWEAGTGTTETVVSPAKVAAAIAALGGGGGGTPAGSNTELQLNNSGAFGAATGVTWASNQLLINAQAAAVTPMAVKLAAAHSALGFELQNSAGTSIASFDANGSLRVSGGDALGMRIGDATTGGSITGVTSMAIGIAALSGGAGGRADCTYVGHSSGFGGVGSTKNTVVGAFAGYRSHGASNTYFGAYCGTRTTGNFNVVVGAYTGIASGFANDNNTIVGYMAGSGINNVTADDNTLLGFTAGDNITSGARNIIIGSGQDADSATGDDQINIGGRLFHDRLLIKERSSDPADPAEGQYVTWMSDGTGSGDDGDIMMKITAGATTKTVTLVDFSAA